GDFLDLVGFEHVVLFDVVEAGQADTAFHAALDFLGVVLLALERVERVIANGASFAVDANPTATLDRARGHIATGDGADAADRKHLLDQRSAEFDHAFFRLKLAAEHRFDVVGNL